jgi:hypothetical protein
MSFNFCQWIFRHSWIQKKMGNEPSFFLFSVLVRWNETRTSYNWYIRIVSIHRDTYTCESSYPYIYRFRSSVALLEILVHELFFCKVWIIHTRTRKKYADQIPFLPHGIWDIWVRDHYASPVLSYVSVLHTYRISYEA